MGISPGIQSDLVIIACTAIYVGLTIIIPKVLKEHGIISRFLARKLIHSFSGLAIFIAPYLTYPVITGVLALIMAILTRESKEKSKAKPLKELYEAISEEEEVKVGYLEGPFAYCLAITILMFVFVAFPDKYYFPIASILIMMFSDTAASIVGRRYGKHHIYVPWVGNKRTLEGTMTFFVTALAISLLSFSVFGRLFPGNSLILTFPQILLLSVVLSAISALLELVSPSKFDDLIVPLGSTLLISLFAILLQIW
jgi:phytol kinase